MPPGIGQAISNTSPRLVSPMGSTIVAGANLMKAPFFDFLVSSVPEKDRADFLRRIEALSPGSVVTEGLKSQLFEAQKRQRGPFI